jgi:hypothetical protein
MQMQGLLHHLIGGFRHAHRGLPVIDRRDLPTSQAGDQAIA